MKRLAILGASGHGKVVADCAERAGWSEIVFYDDKWPDLKANGVWSVSGDTDSLLNELREFDGIIVAIGDNTIRITKHSELKAAGGTMVTIVHPSAVVSKYVTIGEGSVVMPGSVVNVDSNLGECCIINTGATIDHDTTIGNGVHISPGANISGGVSVGDGAWVGVGSTVRQLIHIGSKSTVAAGAVVVDDVSDGITVTGVPAKSFA